MRARSSQCSALNAPIRILLVLVGIAALLGAAPRAGRAGDLQIYEGSVGPGNVRAVPGPVTNLLLDVDYAPASAEGGRLFGLSELEIEATGNLALTPTGFVCQAISCLYTPLPFATGNRIRLTGGNDLAGESAVAANLLTIGVTGSAGYVVVSGGEYLDGTGAAGGVGTVRTADVSILLTVPEPGLAAGLAAPCALLAVVGRRRKRRERGDLEAAAQDSFSISSIGTRAWRASSSGTVTVGPSFTRQR